MGGKPKSWSKWAIILAATITGFYSLNQGKWKKQSVIQTDAFVYYSYLPAVFIYSDLNFDFYHELNQQGIKGEFWTLHAPNGRRVQKMSMGTAYLYLPFFLVGHAYATLTGQANGYSPPYHAAILFAAWFYTIAALIFLRSLLLRHFEDRSVAIAIIGIWLGTNLFHYSSNEAGMSHAYSFFLFAAFFLISQRIIEGGKSWNYLLLGSIAGLIVLVRPTNVVIGLFPLLLGISNFDELKARLGLFLGDWRHVLLLLIGVLLIWAPQLIYWKVQTGHWWWYSYQDEGFFFSDPKILDALISYRKGWLLYTPLALIALFGIIRLYNIKHSMRWVLITYFPIYLYITFSWWCWWYGGSFSQRVMIESYALLIFPLAGIIEYGLDRYKVWMVSFVMLLFIGHNQFETYQYKKTLIHWDSMTKEAYWAVFMKSNFPPNYGELIETPDYEGAKKGIR